MKLKMPAFQFYPGDWRRDAALRACSLEARGLWIELMAIMHDGDPYGHLSVNGVALTDAQAASMVGVPLARYRKLLAELEAHGVPSRTSAGVLLSRRMVRDHGIRVRRAEGGTKSLGNPNVPRPKPAKKGAKGPAEGRPSRHPSPGSFEGSPAVAVASASAEEPGEKKSPVKEGEGSPRGGWPARLHEIFLERVGDFPPAQFGKLLRTAVEKHGEEAVLRAARSYCAKAPDTEKPQFVNPAGFAKQVGIYIENTRPGSALDLYEVAR